MSNRRWKLLLWTAVAGAVFGLIGFGELAEDVLRVDPQQPSHAQGQRRHRPRRDRRQVAARGRPLAVAARQLRRTDRQADRGRREADLLRHHLRRTAATPADDAMLAEAHRPGSGTSPLPVSAALRHARRRQQPDLLPPECSASMPNWASISVAYNYQNAVWRLHYSRASRREAYSVLCGEAGRTSKPDAIRTFIARLFDRPEAIPIIRAADILHGRVRPTGSSRARTS